MKLKRVGVMSAGKILGVLYAIFGFVAGAILLFVSLVAPGEEGGVAFGVAAPIMLSILYGLMGFLGGLISAWLYNLIAKKIGGIEMDLE